MRYPHTADVTREISEAQEEETETTEVNGFQVEGSGGFLGARTLEVGSYPADFQDSLSELTRARSGEVERQVNAVCYVTTRGFNDIEDGDQMRFPFGTYTVQGRRLIDEALLLE